MWLMIVQHYYVVLVCQEGPVPICVRSRNEHLRTFYSELHASWLSNVAKMQNLKELYKIEAASE